jgi:hypothetical protein
VEDHRGASVELRGPQKWGCWAIRFDVEICSNSAHASRLRPHNSATEISPDVTVGTRSRDAVARRSDLISTTGMDRPSPAGITDVVRLGRFLSIE